MSEKAVEMKREPLTLAGLIENHLSTAGHDVTITRLGDDSGTSVEMKKREGEYEYVIALSFNTKETELLDVHVFRGKVIEKVDHRRIV